jgi:hypothetical protein
MGSGHPKYDELFGKYLELKKEAEASIKVSELNQPEKWLLRIESNRIPFYQCSSSCQRYASDQHALPRICAFLIIGHISR